MPRNKSLGRKVELRSPARKFFIFTEGKNTEPEYFEALNKFLKGVSAVPVVVKSKKIGEPEKTANAAIEKIKRLKDDAFGKDDQVWAAFDKDTHPRVDESIQKCKDEGVGVAYSNPCFEVWLILHFQDYNKPCTSEEAQEDLEALDPKYCRKGKKTADFPKLLKNLTEAEKRAVRQINNREQEERPLGCPSTTVHNLTIALREAHESFKVKP